MFARVASVTQSLDQYPPVRNKQAVHTSIETYS